MRRDRLTFIFSFAFLLIALGAIILQPALGAPDFPTPSPYPISWELSFTHSLPKRIAVDVEGTPTPKGYWYMTYTVTNNTDRERKFYPQIDLLTTDGNVHAADENIPKKVFDEIKIAERNSFLEEFVTINGPVRLGPAEARDAVAIWPETTPRMEHFSIFVTGLSGEHVILKNINGKLTRVDTADEIYSKQSEDQLLKQGLIILRKTLQLNFFIRGDDVYPGQDEVNKGSEEWIMR
jgi:hypothetical protein